MNYLLNYGVSQNAPRFEEIDITDKMALEDQINIARKEYFNLLSLLDEIDGKALKVKKKLNAKTKDIMIDAGVKGVRPNELFNTDDDYIEAEYELECFKTAKDMISQRISFVQNDLRILNSTFYTKF